MPRRFVYCVLVLGALAALTACEDKGAATPDPTVPTAPSSTTSSSTAAAVDISTIPATIDEPYLNAVLAALDEIDGEATRIIKAAEGFPPAAADLLRSITSEEEFGRQSGVWFTDLAEDPELSGIRADPGPRRTVVERVISRSPSCVWMAIARDYSATNINPGPQRIEYLELRPKDARAINPTAWMISTYGHRSDGTEPADPCEE